MPRNYRGPDNRYLWLTVLVTILIASLGFINKSKAGEAQQQPVILHLKEPTTGAVAVLSCVTITTTNQANKDYK